MQSPICAAMLRRVLTCLALITGLAATGAPANAALIEAWAAQAQSEEERAEPGKKQACECRERRSETRQKPCEERDEPRPRKRTIIYIPTVQFGPDRAYE